MEVSVVGNEARELTLAGVKRIDFLRVQFLHSLPALGVRVEVTVFDPWLHRRVCLVFILNNGPCSLQHVAGKHSALIIATRVPLALQTLLALAHFVGAASLTQEHFSVILMLKLSQVVVETGVEIMKSYKSLSTYYPYWLMLLGAHSGKSLRCSRSAR